LKIYKIFDLQLDAVLIGKLAFLVGCYVRDLLMGSEPADYDVATSEDSPKNG